MRQSGVDTLITEEPDDRIGHVRICGGDGSVMAVSTRKPTRQRRARLICVFGAAYKDVASPLRKMDPFVLKKADPLCARYGADEAELKS